MIKFFDEFHIYESIIPDNRRWTSVSGILKKLKSPFDAIAMSESCSKKMDSKWYGLTPEDIRAIWSAENKRSIDLGKWYHWMKEIGEESLNICPVIDGWKYALPQKLEDGIYPEFILYDDRYNICGQCDKLIVENGYFDICDYKSNKNISSESNYFFKYPLSKMMDTTLNMYTLQLSLYAAMVMYHNPHLKLRKLEIIHVRFDIRGYDKYGYPMMIFNKETGQYKVKKEVPIRVPFLNDAVHALTKEHLKRQALLT